MRRPAQASRKTLITMAAAGGVLAMGGGYAHADSGASGHAANSPGLLSGNNVQVPVNAPVNACGNTVTVVGGLNPAFGNHCSNGSDDDGTPDRPDRPDTPDHPGNPGSPGQPGDDEEEPCDDHPGTPGTGNPGDGNPGNGSPGNGNPGNGNPGNGNPGNGNPGNGNPGNGNPGTPGDQTAGTPGAPGTGTGPATGSVTPVTHPAPETGITAPSVGLAATGSGDVLTAGLPLAGGLLLGGAVLYRRARNAA